MPRSRQATPPVPAPRHLPGAGLLLQAIAGLLLACGQPAPPPTITLPDADLAQIEGSVRTRLVAVRAEAEALRVAEPVDPAALAEAIARLGHHYLAYDLFDEAAACYTAAASLEPAEPRWPYGLGLALQSAGRPGPAAEAYATAHRLAPEEIPPLLRQAQVRLEEGDLDAAAEVLDAAEARAANLAAVAHGRGEIAAARGQADDAARAFERTLELQPEASSVHYQLALAYRKLGRLAEAEVQASLRGSRAVSFPDPWGREVARAKVETAFQVVIDMAGQPTARLANVLGFAIVQFGDVSGAPRELSELVEGKAETLARAQLARSRYVVGALYQADGAFPEAERAYERALESDRSLVEARVQLASVVGRRGRVDEAVAMLAEVLEAQPELEAALLRRAAILADAGRPGAARTDLEKLLELEPDHSEARLRLAAVDEALGRPERARDEYRSALDLEMEAGDRAVVHLRLAALADRSGDTGEAVDQLRSAVRLSPGDLTARMRLASHLQEVGRAEEALEELERAKAAAPERPEPRAATAAALISLGRHHEAREILEGAVDRFPDDRPLAALLARHLAACPEPSVRDGQRALELALRLVSDRATPEVVETLAMAQAESGRLDEAAATQLRLLEELERAGAPGTDLERLRGGLARYRAGRPCCDG